MILPTTITFRRDVMLNLGKNLSLCYIAFGKYDIPRLFVQHKAPEDTLYAAQTRDTIFTSGDVTVRMKYRWITALVV